MKSKLPIFFFICFSCLYSCKKENVDCCLTRDTNIEISFLDDKGNNLLDPKTAGSYNNTNVDLFYLKNEQKERVYNSNMDYPENFFVFENNGNYHVRLFPSEYVVDNKSATYIEFNKNDTDTLICQVNKAVCTRVWYNDKLVWNGNGPRYFEIKK